MIEVDTEGWPVRNNKMLLDLTIKNGDIELRLIEVSAAHASMYVATIASIAINFINYIHLRDGVRMNIRSAILKLQRCQKRAS